MYCPHLRRWRTSVAVDRVSQATRSCASVATGLPSQHACAPDNQANPMVGRMSFTRCSHPGEDFTDLGIGEYIEEVVQAGESVINAVPVPGIPHGKQKRREHGPPV